MTCKDCIHEIVCEKLCPRGLLPYQSSEYPAELFCKHFKNKANVVEVVRCKDCKHQEQCCEFIMISGKDKNIDFCSCGKRSEGDGTVC